MIERIKKIKDKTNAIQSLKKIRNIIKIIYKLKTDYHKIVFLNIIKRNSVNNFS